MTEATMGPWRDVLAKAEWVGIVTSPWARGAFVIHVQKAYAQLGVIRHSLFRFLAFGRLVRQLS